MRLLSRCLSWLKGAAFADAVLGDLQELRRARRERNVFAAVWFWRTAVGILFHVGLHSLRDAARSVAHSGEISTDARHAMRALRRAPGFASAAILLIALGTGASTAIFSVAYGVALRPLPYPDPERLVRIYESHPASGKSKQDVSIPAFHTWRERATVLEAAALYTQPRARFLAGTVEHPVTTMGVTPSFFDVLGVAPALGSGFKREREYTRFTLRELVVSHAAWQRLFGGDRGILGRTVQFADDDDAFRIVGVMPVAFAFDGPVDFWQPKIVEQPLGRIMRNWRYDRVVARVRAGATLAQARAELDTVAAQLAQEFPAQHGGWTVVVEPLHDAVVGTFARASGLLVATVVVVLGVTWLNVGGLVVARAVARDRDTAVRAALGADAWRMLRLRVAEAAALTGSGGALGVVLAWWTVGVLKSAAPPGIPRLDAIQVDLPTLAIAALSSTIAVILLTIGPAGRRGALVESLRNGSRAAGDHRSAQLTRLTLTVAQCAGAAALVVLAAMLTRSFVKLTASDLGWNADGVLSLSVSPPMPPELRRPWFRYVEWSDRLVARLEAAPGIERAAITTQVPLSGHAYPSTLARGRGQAGGDTARWPAVTHHVTDGYFDLMGIRVVSGRTFTAADRFSEAQVNFMQRAERGVAVVTESTARTLWAAGQVVGQALWLPDGRNVEWHEVIGVVEDFQFHGIGETPALHVFVPWTQHSTGRPRLLVRGSSAAAAIVPLVRAVVQEVEPGTRMDSIAPLAALVSRATAQPRFTSQLVSAFGTLALVLAAVGIYGSLSYLVRTRMREIGVRLALGATPSRIMAMVLLRAVVPALAGAAVGLAVAVALARVFRTLLFHVEPLDPVSIAAGAAVLGGVAVAAALVPARRASRVDPTVALRSE